jgi:glycine hydroxymethyltransferase
MDVTAGLIHAVLSQTQPGTNPDGTPSKARHTLDPAVASRVSRQAAELLASYPLYPAIDLGANSAS